MELALNTVQKLCLSQKMLQSTEILQMSSQELTDYLQNLSENNPVVELEEHHESLDKYERLKSRIESMQPVYESTEYSSSDDDDENYKEKWNIETSRGECIQDYLIYQIFFLPLPKLKRKVAEFIVHCIDHKGYLGESVDTIAEALKVNAKIVEDTLSVIQMLDPAGIGARDLKECLSIQLKRFGIQNPLAFSIVENELETLAKNQLQIIAKKYKAAMNDVIYACDIIRSLNPKPANSFSSQEDLKYITPDIIIVKNNDAFEIVLNNAIYPKVYISNYYKNIISSGLFEEAKVYIDKKLKQAEWVMRCVSLRNETLINTVNTILSLQKNFFLKGPNYIAPMKLNDISEKLQIHESTVSRAVKDKYLQCAWGVYPLCHFFNTAIESKGDSPLTPCRVKNMIKDIIHSENPSKPKSDREITELLNESGIKISRRTVAKYREEMEIFGAQGRKKFA